MQNDDDDQNILINQVQGRKEVRRKYVLEPALLLLFFGYNLSGTIVQNQLLKQTCLYTLGFNETICSEFNSNNVTKSIEELVQPHVAKIMMSTSLLNSIIPSFLCLFLGPWTDKFGRKKVINSSFIGFTLTLGWISAVSYISDNIVTLSPWHYFFAHIPLVLTGGWPTLIIVMLCYITDLTDEADRSFRLGIVEVIIFTGVLTGMASCSFVLQLTNASTVFVISFSCAALATIFTILAVEESIHVPENITTVEQIKELLSPVAIQDMFSTLFKRRSFKERRILWCLVIILMFTVFTLNGTSNVSYLFMREKFGWSLKQATLYDSISMLITIIGSIIGLTIFKKLLKISDMTLAVLSLASAFTDSIIKAFATEPWHLYAASGVTLFKILSSPMCRSLISTIIPNHEIGKIYSVTSSFESISGLGASPLYTFIYANTFTYFTGAFYLITATVYAMNLILAICIGYWRQIRETLMNPYSHIET